MELDGHAAEGLLDLAVGGRFGDFKDGVVGGDVGVEAGFDALDVLGADAEPGGHLADDLDLAGVDVAVGLGDAVEVLEEEQSLAVLHHGADLAADGAGVHVLLQDLAEGEDVALGGALYSMSQDSYIANDAVLDFNETIEAQNDLLSEGVRSLAARAALLREAFNLDSDMHIYEEGLQLSEQDKLDLVAFMESFTDTTFLTNEAFSAPN